MKPRTLPALLLAAGLAAPATAAEPDASAPAPGVSAPAPDDAYSVKVSLSREDPDIHGGTSQADLIDFYLFVDGAPTRGAEFGTEIEGGTLVAYIIDTDKAWVSLPMENPYPGTIAQVKAGPDCFEPPTYFGRLMIRPDHAGDPVTVRVIPSVRAGQAAVLHCDQSGTYELQAYHAAVNAEPHPPEHLVSAKQTRTPQRPNRAN